MLHSLSHSQCLCRITCHGILNVCSSASNIDVSFDIGIEATTHGGPINFLRANPTPDFPLAGTIVTSTSSWYAASRCTTGAAVLDGSNWDSARGVLFRLCACFNSSRYAWALSIQVVATTPNGLRRKSLSILWMLESRKAPSHVLYESVGLLHSMPERWNDSRGAGSPRSKFLSKTASCASNKLRCDLWCPTPHTEYTGHCMVRGVFEDSLETLASPYSFAVRRFWPSIK